MRRAWPVLLFAPALLLGCAGSIDTSRTTTAAASSPRLTVAMLRQAELQRQANAQADELMQALAPSQGDVIGLGGSFLGDLAGGLPGGAALNLGGQMAGGNTVAKSIGSTVGGLLGAVLGPIGGILGSFAGGFAGKQVHSAMIEDPESWADPGAIYIEGMDTGPLTAVTSPAVEPNADKT